MTRKPIEQVINGSSERGVSKVTGAVLMVAIVVVLASITGGFVLGLGERLNNPAPAAHIDFGVEQGSTAELVVTHNGGESFTNDNTGTVSVYVVGDGSTVWGSQTVSPSHKYFVDLDEEKLSAGDEIRFEITDASPVDPGDKVLVVWESPDESSSAVIAEHRVSDQVSSTSKYTNPATCTVNGASKTINYTGSGTASDPFQVTNVTELQCMNANLDAHYALTQDIDATATSSWNGGDGFKPVGPSFGAGGWFTGALYGNGHSINGLTIDNGSMNSAGLFGIMGQGTVRNVHLTNADVTGNKYVGGMVGVNWAGTIESSSVQGTIEGTETGSRTYAGGIAGFHQGTVVDTSADVSVDGHNLVGGITGSNAGTIVNSQAAGAVNGSSTIGGLVGNMDGDITDSSSSATVTATDWPAGGLVGSTSGGVEIVRSHATGDVTASLAAGGLVGDMSSGDHVEDSWASGAVTATASGGDAGGLIGHMSSGGGGSGNMTVNTSYAVGAVSGPNSGGLVGGSSDPESEVTDSYWDTQTTGESSSVGGTGLTTSEMTGSAAKTNMVGFDFTNIWKVVSGDYPELQ